MSYKKLIDAILIRQKIFILKIIEINTLKLLNDPETGVSFSSLLKDIKKYSSRIQKRMKNIQELERLS